MLKIVPRDASDAVTTELNVRPLLSPAARLLAVAMVLLGLSAATLAVDIPISQWFSQRGLPGELRRLVRLSEVFAWGGSVAVIIAAAALLDPRGWRVVLPLAAQSLGAGLVADGVKLLVARSRPSTANGAVTAADTFAAWLPLVNAESLSAPYGRSFQSFPSAHSATAVGLAIALSALYPRGRWLFAALAVLAMVQRIDAQAHYCSDVLAGAAVGCMVSAVCVLTGIGGCRQARGEVV